MEKECNVTNVACLKSANLPVEHDEILVKLLDLYRDLFLHDGYGTLRVEMRYLRKGQKEIVLVCGKEYRFVVDALFP